MKLVVEVTEKDYNDFVLQNSAGILDEKVPSQRAKIAIANGTIIEQNESMLGKGGQHYV